MPLSTTASRPKKAQFNSIGFDIVEHHHRWNADLLARHDAHRERYPTALPNFLPLLLLLLLLSSSR